MKVKENDTWSRRHASGPNKDNVAAPLISSTTLPNHSLTLTDVLSPRSHKPFHSLPFFSLPNYGEHPRMAKRKAANGVADASGNDQVTQDDGTTASATATPSTSRRIVDDIVAASAAAAKDPIKVNVMNVSDLKNACDDAIKKVQLSLERDTSACVLTRLQLLSQPELFQEIHTHTDVKLALGWASVLIAGATALYGWKIDFEQSKPFVWAGVILYELHQFSFHKVLSLTYIYTDTFCLLPSLPSTPSSSRKTLYMLAGAKPLPSASKQSVSLSPPERFNHFHAAAHRDTAFPSRTYVRRMVENHCSVKATRRRNAPTASSLQKMACCSKRFLHAGWLS